MFFETRPLWIEDGDVVHVAFVNKADVLVTIEIVFLYKEKSARFGTQPQSTDYSETYVIMYKLPT